MAVVDRVLVPVRPPFDLAAHLRFLAARTIPGVEHWDGERYARALDLAHGQGVVTIGPELVDGAIAADVVLADERDRVELVSRLERLFDGDADVEAIAATLGADPVLAPMVRAAPGRRVPGSVDPFETMVRAIVGQQVSVAGARTVAGRIVAAAGERLSLPASGLSHVFPGPSTLAGADRSWFSMPTRRAETIVEVARRVSAGDLPRWEAIDAGALVTDLLAVPGIGPWTAGYVAMRAFAAPDVFLPTDVGVRHGLARLGVGAERAERWRPWRSYALHHLWAIGEVAA